MCNIIFMAYVHPSSECGGADAILCQWATAFHGHPEDRHSRDYTGL